MNSCFKKSCFNILLNLYITSIVLYFIVKVTGTIDLRGFFIKTNTSISKLKRFIKSMSFVKKNHFNNGWSNQIAFVKHHRWKCIRIFCLKKKLRAINMIKDVSIVIERNWINLFLEEKSYKDET